MLRNEGPDSPYFAPLQEVYYVINGLMLDRRSVVCIGHEGNNKSRPEVEHNDIGMLY